MKKRFSVILFMTSIFSFLTVGFASPFWPIIGAVAAIPGMGGLMNAKAASAKETLNNVEITIFLVKLFLLAVVFCATLVFFIRLIKRIKKARFNKYFHQVTLLLARVQADMILLKNVLLQEQNEEIDGIALSIQKNLLLVIKNSEEKLFVKHVDSSLRTRMNSVLQMIQKGEVAIDDQIQIVDHWGRIIKRLVQS